MKRRRGSSLSAAAAAPCCLSAAAASPCCLSAAAASPCCLSKIDTKRPDFIMWNNMKSRCAYMECKARIPSFTPECKCKSKFCGAHRGHVDHACPFDYKEEHATNLLKTMSTAIVADKMERI